MNKPGSGDMLLWAALGALGLAAVLIYVWFNL